MTDTDIPEIRVEDRYTASNGLVLRLKKVPRLLLVDAVNKLKAPKVPRWFNEDKGREEDNPQDPDYIQAVQDHKNEQGMMSITLMLATGTEPIDMPAGVEPAESDDWLDVLNELGMSLDFKNKRVRYTAWLKYHALPGDEFNDVIQAVLRYSGITLQADVDQAQRSFRSETDGPGHNGNVPATEGGPGDNVGELVELRPGTRRT